jgi:uncharacterized protein
MKYIHDTDMHQLEGTRIAPSQNFAFRCRPTLECFNRCCHNLNLFLYPYDVLRLKKAWAFHPMHSSSSMWTLCCARVNFFPKCCCACPTRRASPALF